MIYWFIMMSQLDLQQAAIYADFFKYTQDYPQLRVALKCALAELVKRRPPGDTDDVLGGCYVRCPCSGLHNILLRLYLYMISLNIQR